MEISSSNNGPFTLSFDDATNDLTNNITDAQHRVSKAVNRAVKKTARWLKTHSMRDIGKELGIKQAPLKRRFLISTNPQAPSQATVWFGLLAIAAHDVGRARQTKAGVNVGKHRFEGAFYRAVYGDNEKVYIRTKRNDVAGHHTISGRHNRGYSRDMNDPSLAGRFPVQVVGIDIQDVSERIVQRYEARLNQRYREILAHELRFAISIE